MTKRKVRKDKIEFNSEDIIKIETLAGIGLNLSQISSELGIGRETLYRRIREGNEELSEAIYRGRAKAISKIASVAYELALEGDSGMIKYWLSCRGGWSEKSQIILEGGNNPIEVSNISDKQLKRMAEEYLTTKEGKENE